MPQSPGAYGVCSWSFVVLFYGISGAESSYLPLVNNSLASDA